MTRYLLHDAGLYLKTEGRILLEAIPQRCGPEATVYLTDTCVLQSAKYRGGALDIHIIGAASRGCDAHEILPKFKGLLWSQTCADRGRFAAVSNGDYLTADLEDGCGVRYSR